MGHNPVMQFQPQRLRRACASAEASATRGLRSRNGVQSPAQGAAHGKRLGNMYESLPFPIYSIGREIGMNHREHRVVFTEHTEKILNSRALGHRGNDLQSFLV